MHTIRASEIPLNLIGEEIGPEVQEVLAKLRPALIAWELQEERTTFFLDHQADLTQVIAFVQEEGRWDNVSREVRWYLKELREDLRSIFHAGATSMGMGTHFSIHNRPQSHRPIAPREWHPLTIAFVEALRPSLATVIKPRYIDTWLQTPLDILGGRSPIQMIECGQGERVRALIEEMRNGWQG